MKNELISRLKSETPRWFKRIIFLCAGLGGSAAAIRLGYSEAGIDMPDFLERILEYMVVASIFGGVIAKTACTDTTKPEEKQ